MIVGERVNYLGRKSEQCGVLEGYTYTAPLQAVENTCEKSRLLWKAACGLSLWKSLFAVEISSLAQTPTDLCPMEVSSHV